MQQTVQYSDFGVYSFMRTMTVRVYNIRHDRVLFSFAVKVGKMA